MADQPTAVLSSKLVLIVHTHARPNTLAVLRADQRDGAVMLILSKPVAAISWTLKASAQATGTNATSTPAINTTGADLIVFCVAYYSSGTGVSVSDSMGNTWTTAGS